MGSGKAAGPQGWNGRRMNEWDYEFYGWVSNVITSCTVVMGRM